MVHTLNSGDLLAAGVKTLSTIINNVVANPAEEKYRKLRVNNPAIQKKVVPLIGGIEFLEIAGFTRITDEAGNLAAYRTEPHNLRADRGSAVQCGEIT